MPGSLRLPRQPDRPLGTHYAKEGGERLKGCYYGNLAIQADAADVHKIALELLRSHVRERASVLDIAAGSGALSQRLLDNGFTGLEAIELCAERFGVAGIPVHPLNLDKPWADQLPGRYAAAVALEIIEHLENPWHFARECALALRPGGVLVLSTPNIQSSRSRIEFLLRAEFRFFGERDYHKVGHITSLTSAQLVRIFARAGFSVLEQQFSRHKGMYRPGNPKRALRAALYALSYPFMSGVKHGETTLFAFRRAP